MEMDYDENGFYDGEKHIEKSQIINVEEKKKNENITATKNEINKQEFINTSFSMIVNSAIEKKNTIFSFMMKTKMVNILIPKI